MVGRQEESEGRKGGYFLLVKEDPRMKEDPKIPGSKKYGKFGPCGMLGGLTEPMAPDLRGVKSPNVVRTVDPVESTESG